MNDQPDKLTLTKTRPPVVEPLPRPVLPEAMPAADCAAADRWVQVRGDRVHVLRWSGATAESGPAATRLSVVIPMYNEEARVSGVLADAIDYLRNQPFPTCLLLVDDGSSDRTSAIAVAMLRAAPEGSLHTATLVRHAVNRGKASAICTGLWLALGAHRLVMDADGSTPLSEVQTLLDAAMATGAGLVVGSRALRPDMVRQSFKRRISHLIFRAWVRANGFRTVRDSQCGFKLYRADVAEALCAPGTGLSITSGYEFDLEHIELSRRLGHRVQEVPVIWVDKPGSKVRLVRDALAMARGVQRLRERLASLPEGFIESKPSVASEDGPAAHASSNMTRSLGAILLATHPMLELIPESLGMRPGAHSSPCIHASGSIRSPDMRYPKRSILFALFTAVAAIALGQAVGQQSAPVPGAEPPSAAARLAAAEKACKMLHDLNDGTPIAHQTVEHSYLWSLRRFEAQRDVEFAKDHGVAAAQRHLDHVKALNAKLADANAKGAFSKFDVAATEYYVAEAEELLAKARAR